jgi:hypothetical protein
VLDDGMLDPHVHRLGPELRDGCLRPSIRRRGVFRDLLWRSPVFPVAEFAVISIDGLTRAVH